MNIMSIRFYFYSMSIVKRIIKNKWFVILAVLIISAIVWSVFGALKQVPQITIKVERGSLTQEVNVTGKTKPVQSLDLAFERSGKVIKVNADVGDKVTLGQVIAIQDQSDLSAQVAQAEAALAIQDARLSDMVRGTRPEELRIAQTSVENAQKTLDNTTTNLANVTSKSESDLIAVYADALGAMIKSLNIATNSLMILTDMQFAHYTTYDQTSAVIANAKAQAIVALLGGQNGGRWTNDIISSATGGAKGLVLKAQSVQTMESVDVALPTGRDALMKVKTALDAMPTAPYLTSTESTNLNTEKNTITNETIISVTKQETITTQRALNQNLITAANASVTTASNTLASAKDTLALKQAGPTEQEIAAQRAQVQQAQANLQSVKVQLDKTVLHAPFAGVITKQNAKVGQIVSAQVSTTSLLADEGYEIEANVPEVDIGRIAKDNVVHITFDAFPQEKFEGNITLIDPAETIVDGVANYKITVIVPIANGRLKSGLTANLSIETVHKENILILPQFAIVENDQGTFVRKAGATTVDIPVQIGIRSQDGRVEMISGVQEGDEVLNIGFK